MSKRHKLVIPLHPKTWFLVLLAVFSLTVGGYAAIPAGSDTALASVEAPPSLPEAGLPNIPNYQAGEESFLRSRGRQLPAAYDSRTYGYITPVRNQDPFGTCWAFAALAAGEASMVKKGIADSTIDLSELHFAYFFYNTVNDPLKNTKGDKVINQTGYHYMDAGGNNLFTMFALAKWTGPALESKAPYRTTLTPSLKSRLAYQDAAHLQNARFVNSRDIDSVKDLILQYGAVSSAMYYQGTYLNKDNGAYNSPESEDHYYINNHVVCLVGWDDNYPRENFLIQPSRDGAWIAKNSYGVGEGDQGYLYISYEDAVLGGKHAKDALSYAFDLESADNYDHNYQYDGSSSIETLKISSGGSLSNVYTVKGNPGGNERLEAVSFALVSQNVNYSIQIYKNPKKGSPTSGSPVFPSPQTGSTTYSGYYTVELENPPVFAQGDTFAVVITFRSKNGSRIESFIDLDSNVDDVKFVSKSADSLSFFRASSGSAWEDLNTFCESATARIKAFTTDTSTKPTKIDVISDRLSKPKIRSLKAVSCTRAKITWSGTDQAVGYEIFRSTDKNGSYQRIARVRSCSYVDRQKTPGTTYYYRIRAYGKENKTTVYSKFSSAKSLYMRPEKPQITSAKYNGSRKIRLTWKKLGGVNGYAIYRSTKRDYGFELVTRVKKKATKYTDQTPENRVYYYKIRAFRNVNGKRLFGRYSSVVKVK